MQKIISKLLLIWLLISFQNLWAETMNNFTLNSQSFSANATLSAKYTCDGEDISPQFSWQNAPANTQSYALILSDADAPSGPFYHWVIFNIPSNIKELPEQLQTLPNGAQYGNNSWNKAQYNGPCPPKGSKHRYYFTLYALDQRLNLADGSDPQTIINAINAHTLAESQLMVTFGH